MLLIDLINSTGELHGMFKITVHSACSPTLPGMVLRLISTANCRANVAKNIRLLCEFVCLLGEDKTRQ